MRMSRFDFEQFKKKVNEKSLQDKRDTVINLLNEELSKIGFKICSYRFFNEDDHSLNDVLTHVRINSDNHLIDYCMMYKEHNAEDRLGLSFDLKKEDWVPGEMFTNSVEYNITRFVEIVQEIKGEVK